MLCSFASLLTPHGALRLEAVEDGTAVDPSAAKRLEASFRKGDGHGLLQLGLAEAGTSLPPDLAFWRAFAMRFVIVRS
jgi:non-specific serine/threonine protein kinase